MSGIHITLLGNQVAAPTGPVWTPNGGASAGTPVSLQVFELFPSTAVQLITCSQTATWTWSSTGSGTLSSTVASGGSATSITFTLTGNSGLIRSRTITLSSTSGGVTKYWSIYLEVDGT